MVIKKAAYVGRAVKTLLEEEAVTIESMSADLNISSQMGSHIKNNRRRMQQGVAKHSLQVYEDSPEYMLDLLYEFSDGFTSPVFRGETMEQHRLAMRDHTAISLKQTLDVLQKVSLAKKPEATNAKERESVEKLIDQLIEARCFIDNLNVALEKEYGISVKKRAKKLLPKWKMEGWKE
ncbi:hypothetical protein MKZ02_20280 [Pseudobacillus sp. FSL P4-0506]|uniref:hypothetical protein n=1 Tax=Pseudobacillus sp. FSL P4-0506 TaxID=2921576 RepID=UPI0030F6B73B